MATIGIIGLGSMGTSKAFCESHAGVQAATTVDELAARADWIFVAVPPAKVRGVLEEISSNPKQAFVIPLAASVTLACLQSVVGTRVSRAIPNITAEVDSGVFLVCHGTDQDASAALARERLLASRDRHRRLELCPRYPLGRLPPLFGIRRKERRPRGSDVSRKPSPTPRERVVSPRSVSRPSALSKTAIFDRVFQRTLGNHRVK